MRLSWTRPGLARLPAGYSPSSSNSWRAKKQSVTSCVGALRKPRKKKFRPTKPLEWWLGRVFIRAAIRFVGLVPYRLLDRPGALLGDAGYFLMPRYRRVALRNLQRAFG